MKNNLATYLNKIMRERKLHRRTLSVLALVAVFVGVTVLWQLHITGIAVTGEALCGMPEHVHTDACLQTEMVCGLQETDGHTHTDDCYTIESILACEEEHDHTNDCFMEVRTLVCGQEECEPHHHTDDCYLTYYLCGYEQEHVHTEACYADEGAEDNWQASIPAELSGNWAADTLAIARSQIGYEESKINYTEDEDGTRHGYTRYGAFYGIPYAPWDAAFVNFCLTNAGVDAAVLPQDTVLENWKQTLSQAGLLAAADNVPQAGDIVFVGDRAGIVSAVGEGTINVIQRDDNGFLSELGYITSDESISGYIAVGALQPAQAETTETAESTETTEQAAETTEPTETTEQAAETAEPTEETSEEETKPETVKNNSKTVKGDDFTITAYYDDEAGIPANAVLKATKYDKDSEEYKAHEEQAGTKFDYLFDIGFYIGIGENEKEIEPLTPVTVTIQFPGDDKQYSVTHFADDGIETPEVDSKYNEQTAEAAVTYETDSFSPFGFSKLTQKVGVYSNDSNSNDIATYATGDTNVTGTIKPGFENGQQYIIFYDGRNDYALTNELGKEEITVNSDQATASTSTLWTYQGSDQDGKLYYTDANGQKQYLYLHDKRLGVTSDEDLAATISYGDNKLKIDSRYLKYDSGFKTDGDEDDASTIKIAVVGGGTTDPDPSPVAPVDPIDPGDDQNELAKHKYVKYNEAEDNYDLTLDIAGKIGTETHKAMVDVIFVLDVSGSMDRNMNSERGDNGERRDAANDAIKAMVGSLSDKAATVDARYSLVTFSGSKNDETTWWGTTTHNDAQTALTWSPNASDLTSALPNSSNGGTNYEAGLYNAKNLLSSARDGAQKVVVFVSDGNPSYYYDENGYTAGNGSDDPNGTCLTHAKNLLGTMGMDCFYTVGVGPSGNYTKLNTDGLLSGITNTQIEKQFFVGNTTDNLKAAFDKIEGSIINYACTNVTVTDTLSDYVEIVPGTDLVVKATKDGAEYTPKANITASLSEDKKIIMLNFPADYELEKDVTYSVTAKIQASQAAKNYYAEHRAYPEGMQGDAGTDADGNTTSSGKAGFYCNDSATVTYTYKGESKGPETYLKPVIQVKTVFEPINFYINLASNVLDMGGNVAGRPVEDFTKSVSGSRSNLNSTLQFQIPATHEHGNANSLYELIVGEDGRYAKEVDTTIRTKLPQGYNYTGGTGAGEINNGMYKLVDTEGNAATFPEDEDIFQYIRNNWNNGDCVNKWQSLTVNGVAVDKDLLTKENFEIRWYVCKDEPGKGDDDWWHIDGILVAKTATLTVTKTFTVEGQSAKQVKEIVEAPYTSAPTDNQETTKVNEAAEYFDEHCFYLTADGEKTVGDQTFNAGNYKLALRNLTGVTDGKIPHAIAPTSSTQNNDGSVTYTWELSVLPATFTLGEDADIDGYIHKDATYSVDSLDNTQDKPAGTKYDPATGAVITTQNVTADAQDKTQRADFVNNYEAGETLPNTGGIGTTLFRILGGCLLVVAVSWCIKRRQLHG